MTSRVVRIGGGQGFYGDGIEGAIPVLATGVDYLVCDALAELTLAILQKDRMKDESLGFTRDLPLYVRTVLPHALAGRTRLITNAGGINPVAAGRAAIEALREAGAGGSGLKVATVVGDDVRPLAAVPGSSVALPQDTLFANAYLGAQPVVRALEQGADIVVTGRVADASLFLAPLIHEHGWAADDWDRLAAGIVVGHLLECSGQVTGGNWSGPWWEHAGFPTGFPIAEVDADGTTIITKPPGTGGCVTFDTVRQQLLYEVHDPSRYLNPDVTADFASLTLTDLGEDRVRVSGTRGRPRPETYKALLCTPAGWAGEARYAYSWPDAPAKARAAMAWTRKRAAEDGLAIDEWCEELFGLDAYGGPTVAAGRDGAAPDPAGPPEVMARLAWRGADRDAVGKVGRGFGIMGLGGPPAISSVGRAVLGGGAGAGPTQLLSVRPFPVDRALVDAQVRVVVEEV